MRDMSDDGAAPESLLPYDQWMEDSLRHVVLTALGFVAANGLPGNHHFYVTFATRYPGVVIPARLLEKYPQEMTIVLQHQFEDLHVDRAARVFGVTLSFGGIPSALTVPLEAVSAFVDPSIQYGLRFKVQMPEAPAEPASPQKRGTQGEAPPTQDQAETVAPQVVSLDAFRKRRD
jgi:hypothetical protein